MRVYMYVLMYKIYVYIPYMITWILLINIFTVKIGNKRFVQKEHK